MDFTLTTRGHESKLFAFSEQAIKWAKKNLKTFANSERSYTISREQYFETVGRIEKAGLKVQY